MLNPAPTEVNGSFAIELIVSGFLPWSLRGPEMKDLRSSKKNYYRDSSMVRITKRKCTKEYLQGLFDCYRNS